MFKYAEKSIEIIYDAGYHYKINYLDDNTLEWVVLGKSFGRAQKNAITQFFWHEISDDIYIINWIEEFGIEVAQTINFKTFDVYAFVTWNDFKLKEGRNYLISIGKIKFCK